MSTQNTVTAQATARVDNMPEKLTAHAIRRLRPCAHCGGIGDGKLMIHGTSGELFHTACYLEQYGFDAALTLLPASELGKFRICDLTAEQMGALHRTWKRKQAGK